MWTTWICSRQAVLYVCVRVCVRVCLQTLPPCFPLELEGRSLTRDSDSWFWSLRWWAAQGGGEVRAWNGTWRRGLALLIGPWSRRRAMAHGTELRRLVDEQECARLTLVSYVERKCTNRTSTLFFSLNFKPLWLEHISTQFLFKFRNVIQKYWLKISKICKISRNS